MRAGSPGRSEQQQTNAQMLIEIYAWVQEERRDTQAKRMALLSNVDHTVLEDIKERAGFSTAHEPALELPSSMTGICAPTFKWVEGPKMSQAGSYILFCKLTSTWASRTASGWMQQTITSTCSDALPPVALAETSGEL